MISGIFRLMTKRRRSIRIFLLGGLGNQLFGVFFYHALKVAFPGRVVATNRLIPFGSNPTRVLIADKIPETKFEEIELIRSARFLDHTISNSRIGRRVVWKYYNFISPGKRIKLQDFWELKKFPEYRVDIVDYCDDWFFPEYVKKNRAIDFSPTEYKLEQRDYENYVLNGIVCHVRVGDYLDHPEKHKLLDERYYLSAIKSITKENKQCSELILVIAENVSEVRQYYPNLANLSSRIIGKSDLDSDLQAFNIMRSATNLVAANSTFSMWAAWFGLYARKRTLVPYVFPGDNPQSGLRELKWEVLNPIDGGIVEKHKFEPWFQEKENRFLEIMSRVQRTETGASANY